MDSLWDQREMWPIYEEDPVPMLGEGGWGVEQRLVLPVGERLGHCAGGGRRDHILSMSNYFCNSVSF